MMNSCPQCNHQLAKNAPAICPSCGFTLVTSDSPTLRANDTAKIIRQDPDDPSNFDLNEEPLLDSPPPTSLDQTIKLDQSNNTHERASAPTLDPTLDPTSFSNDQDDGTTTDPNDATLITGPMQTMNRPLSDKTFNPTLPLHSTANPPTPNDAYEKTITGRRSPTIVNPQAALDAAEAYSKGLQSLIPPRTVVRKEEAADNSDYQLIKRIGSGAYGVVFQAKQVPLERSVAVKLLQNSSDNKEHQQRIKNEFLREAQFTGRLEHPNIVPIHDIGLTVSPNGKVNPFYVMKEIRGESWHGVIEEKSLKENLEIFKNIVNAIAFAHSQNILHCDLKPENIMLGEFGEVLVVDWGQAVDLSVPETMRPGGTPAYISPEMAQYWIDIYLNHKKESLAQVEVGVRSDVYLLGGLLFETITGTSPHCKTPGEPPYDVISKAAKNRIVDYDDTVDKDLLNVALRALRATDGNHIETTADLLIAIDQYENRSLSIQLRRRADQLLETAVAEADYDAFQRSRFSYEEAIEKWRGNKLARKGLKDAKLRCAEQALADQNFDLGLNVLEDTDGDSEIALREKLAEGKRIRDRRKRLVAGLAIGLAGSILLGILINGYMIKKNLESAKARDIAVIEKEQAKDEKVQLESEKASIVADKIKIEKSIEPMRQQQVKMQAKIANFSAKREAQIKQFKQQSAEQQKKFEAEEGRLKREQQQQQEILQAEISTLDQQKKALNDQKETLVVEKQNLKGQVVDLNESSKLLRYKSGLTQISVDLQSGDYFNARKNLNKLENQQEWEVARLNLLAHREIKSLYPDDPVNSISVTADGNQVALAFPDRIEIRKLDALNEPGWKIQQADVSAVAISPDGDRIYAASPGESQLSPGQIAIFDATRPEQTEPIRVLDAQSVSIDQIEINETGSAIMAVGKPSALRQSAGQGLEEPVMVWIDGQQVDVNLVLPNGDRPKFDSASFSKDGQRILLTNRSGLPQDQPAYVFERNETSYRWVATSPIQGISAATFVDGTNNDITIGIQNTNTGSYSLARWRYGRQSSGSVAIVSPLTSKAIQLRQQGNFVIATESNRQATIWDWRDKHSMELKGQSRPAQFCFVKPGERLEDCKVITAAIGDQPELLSTDLSKYQPEFQQQSAGWSPEDRPASVTAVFSSIGTDDTIQAFGNNYGMASVVRNDNQVQWSISAWQYQVASDEYVFAQSAEDYLYRYDRASGALDRVLTKLARYLNRRERIVDFQVSDDGQVALIQTDSDEPKFLLWNLQQDQLIREVNYGQQNLFGTGSNKQLPKLSISRDGKWVVGAKVGVFGWPVDSGRLVRLTSNNTLAARSIANSIVFVRNTQQVLVSWRNRIVQFDLDNQQQIASHSLTKISDAQVQDNLLDAIANNGQIQILAAESTSGGGVLLLSLTDQQQLARFATASFASFATSPTGVSVIAGGLDEDRKIRLESWSQADARPRQVPLPTVDAPSMARHVIGFERVFVSPQHGILLQTSERNRGSAKRMWSSLSIDTALPGDASETTSLGPLQVLSKPSITHVVAQTKQAATLASGQVHFWKLSDKGVKPDGVFGGRVTAMQMAPDKNVLAICTKDNRCLFYDFAKREKRGEVDLKESEGNVTAIAWQPDSKVIAVGRSTGVIEVINLNANNFADSASSTLQLKTPIQQAVSSLAYSDDGSLLATIAGEGKAVLIRARDKKEAIDKDGATFNETVYAHTDEQQISAAHLSADGNRIVSGSNTGRITIWNSQPQPKTTKTVHQATGERELLTLPNLHQSPVSIVRFVDGHSNKMILSAEQTSGKNEIIAWPVAK